VYAVLFPSSAILKIGFTLNKNLSWSTANARKNAQHRGYVIEGSKWIWRQSGDTRVEAWLQATLAFRWNRATKNGNRLCEWFRVPSLTEGEIATVLDEIYGLIPVDQVEAEEPGQL
jgi:hypothetical protein